MIIFCLFLSLFCIVFFDQFYGQSEASYVVGLVGLCEWGNVKEQSIVPLQGNR